MVIRNKWCELSLKFNLVSMKLLLNGYRENKWMVIFCPTTIIGIIGVIMTGFTWYTLMWLPAFIWGYGTVYLSLQIKSKTYEGDSPEYGYYLFSQNSRLLFDSLVICFGSNTVYLDMPWSWDWHRTSYLDNNGKWISEYFGGMKKNFWDDQWDKLKWKEVHPYKYVTNSGEVLDRQATIHVQEHEWRPRVFNRYWKKFPFIPKKISRSIDVEFDQAVGEDIKSFKGGTIGCGYEIVDPELPVHTLKRMERERRFR